MIKVKKNPTPLLFWLIVMGQVGCYYDKEELLYPEGAVNCSTQPAAFKANIKPMIDSKCATAGCHDKTTAAGAVQLIVYDDVVAHAARIRQRCIVEKTMPPGAALSASETAALKCWLDNGMPNN